MGKQKVYCKVCRTVDGKYVSAVMETEGLVVEYKIGVPTKPKVGYLFVFNNLSAVRQFMSQCNDGTFRLFECTTKGPHMKHTCSASVTNPIGVIKDYWYKTLTGHGKHFKGFLYRNAYPDYVLWCKEVTLLREL